MPISICKKCEKEFAYDFDLGLNIKYFASESSSRGFRAGGDFPCCPDCESWCETEESRNYNSSKITMTTQFIPMRVKKLDK
jgi:hypothetical protein